MFFDTYLKQEIENSIGFFYLPAKYGKQSGIILCPVLKVAFFQKVRSIFQISQSPQKIIPKNEKLFTDMDRNIKFQAQDSFLEYFLGDLEI